MDIVGTSLLSFVEKLNCLLSEVILFVCLYS